MPGTGVIAPPARDEAARWLFWATVWLALVLVAVKAYYLGVPPALAFAAWPDYWRSLAAITYVDVLFAGALWGCARLGLTLARARRRAARLVSIAFLSFAAFSCMYQVANVIIFGVFGGFLTYPLLALVGDVRMIRSSVAVYLTPAVVSGLVCLPLAYLALVAATIRLVPPGSGSRWRRQGVVCASLAVYVMVGQHAFASQWTTRPDWRIAENPHWVLLSSWWQAVNHHGTVRMAERFAAQDLADFEPVGVRPPPSPTALVRRIANAATGRRTAARRPPNVILIVLESVAARWASLHDSLYDTTPVLKAESAHGLVFDSFYAHIGRSSNSLGAILLSIYPKLDFRELTQEYPQLPGTSLAAVFRDRGYRTAFMTPSDLRWAGWDTFLQGRGFGELRDFRDLPCTKPLSSWGVEDRCMVDEMIEFIAQNRTNPFFIMGWTQQTHHPYEPTPGVPSLELWRRREPVPDDYDLERYLNVLHETDRHLGRLFDAVRRAGLDQDTLIVITGDHGQAFGYPHASYMQGQTVYEEDVHVPMMLWFPRLYRSPARSKTIASHVDLAPTIADLVGLPAGLDWRGRSVFDAGRVPRAYFYVAEDRFTLGVREGNWKYIFNLREGVDELYDLDRDPAEQHNLAAAEPERSARLRQRLAAWTEATRRQYEASAASRERSF